MQRSFAREVYSKCRIPSASYTQRLEQFRLTTLEERRIRTDLITHGLIEIEEATFFRRPTRITHRPIKLFPSFIPTDDVSKFCHSNRVSPIWNSFSPDLIRSPSLNAFKRSLKMTDMSRIFIPRLH